MKNCNPEKSKPCGKACIALSRNCNKDQPRKPKRSYKSKDSGPRKLPNCKEGSTRLCGKACVSWARKCKSETSYNPPEYFKAKERSFGIMMTGPEQEKFLGQADKYDDPNPIEDNIDPNSDGIYPDEIDWKPFVFNKSLPDSYKTPFFIFDPDNMEWDEINGRWVTTIPESKEIPMDWSEENDMCENWKSKVKKYSPEDLSTSTIEGRFRNKLFNFYTKNHPDKLKYIEELLRIHKRRLGVLNDKLRRKYGNVWESF